MVWSIALAAAWLLLVWLELRAVRALRELPRPPGGQAEPAVTVVMAVRDDAAHIAGSVARLLGQRGVALRLVVVDDRSSDGTGEQLAAVAAHEPRLTVVTVRELPPDWLGKSHALHVGAANVGTPWVLFTDGDAQLADDTLARAIAAAEGSGADHVTLLPTHRDTTPAGRAVLLAFQLTFLRRVAAVNAKRQRSFVGAGAFNLVRSDAYRRVGGHLPLRLEVVDDVWLGWLLKRAGYRSRVWFAPRELAIDWGGTPRGFVHVTTKNMFAVLRYRTWLAVCALAAASGALAASLAAPLVAGPIGWLPCAAMLTGALPGIALAKRMGWSPREGALVPLARWALPVALAHSVWVTLRQRGVRWRGTFYPLAQLRRGQVR